MLHKIAHKVHRGAEKASRELLQGRAFFLFLKDEFQYIIILICAAVYTSGLLYCRDSINILRVFNGIFVRVCILAHRPASKSFFYTRAEFNLIAAVARLFNTPALTNSSIIYANIRSARINEGVAQKEELNLIYL